MKNIYNRYNIEAKYKLYLSSTTFSRSSKNNYFSDVKRFLDWYELKLIDSNLEFTVDLIRYEIFSEYTKYLSELLVPKTTLKRTVSSLKNFSHFLLLNSYIQIDPLPHNPLRKTPFIYVCKTTFKKTYPYILIFFAGFIPIILLFLLPFLSKSESGKLQIPSSNNQPLYNLFANAVASTSADLMTIPIVDEYGTLNLTAPYPKIKGFEGTLTIEAPEIVLQSEKDGSIQINTGVGGLQIKYDGTQPKEPYNSANSFISDSLETGTLIYGKTKTESDQVNLLELVSGTPGTVKFSVDADGNVHIKGNIILEGNLISSPNSVLFGNLEYRSATSSASY
jgi:hypothetical protein